MSRVMANKRGLAAPLLALALDFDGPDSLQRQIYDQIRAAILAGRLAPGSRLPSSRSLGRELACSRNTVVSAYDQLYSEGYLASTTGSGTYVSPVLPEELLGVAAVAQPAAEAPAPPPARLSARGAALAALRRTPRQTEVPFLPGPETAFFPFDVWARLLGRFWRNPEPDHLRHGAAAGYLPLRTAIAQYLKAVRGLVCRPEQVIITSGAQQAIDLVARCLLDPGDKVWIEEPGYAGLRGPFIAAGAELVPLPVAGEGLSLSAGLASAPDARMACITPSHQYPLGTVMSLPRRLALLDWAAAAGAWILEDDYDSEYRYGGKPLSALQGLDRQGRVIYIGSFSKVLFASLRIGYLVVPDALVEPLVQARAVLDDHPSLIMQPALAAFIEEGHFAAHVRRMRTLYGERQAVLLQAAAEHLEGLLDLAPDQAGLHLVAGLAPGLAARMNDREASARAAKAGLAVPALSDYFIGPPTRQGLVLGYAAYGEKEIREGVCRLAEVLQA